MQARSLFFSKVLILSAVITVFFLLTLMYGRHSPPLHDLRSSGSWSVLLGDRPSGSPLPPGDGEGWVPSEQAASLAETAAYRGYYWAKVTLPGLPIRDPYMIGQGQGRIAAYLGGAALYEFNTGSSYVPVYPSYRWNFIRLPDEYEGQTLYLKLHKSGEALNLGQFTLAGRQEYTANALVKDGFKILFSFCFAMAAILSLLLYLRQRSQPMYLYFGLFALCSLHGCFARTFLFNEFWQLPLITYLHDVPFYLGTFSILAFLRALFGDGFRGMRGKLSVFSLVFSVVTLAAALYSDQLYFDIVNYFASAAFMLIFLADSALMFVQLRRQKTSEAQWTMLGYLLLILFGVSHSLFFLLERWDLAAFRTAPALLYFLREDQLSFGIFLFMLCLTMVLVQRFDQVNERVKRYALELEEKNRKLQELDRLKDDFLANTSHELRTPLHGIIGLSEAILADLSGVSEDSRRNVELVISSASRLARLVDDILDFSKLKHSDIVLKQEPVGLHALADLVLTVFGPLAARKGIALVNGVPEGSRVLADPGRLEQILYNLIGNALKFTDSGEVRLTAESAQTGMRIRIRDTGIGIPPEKLPALFEPFTQAAEGLGRGGTGLGLSITKKLVELHGGTITLDSEPGGGTSVAFTLPEADGTLPPPVQEVPVLRALGTPAYHTVDTAGGDEVQSAAGPEEGPLPLILIADDEPVNLLVLQQHLASQPYRLVQARSGTEALELALRSKPDLMLLDVMMPGLSGVEVCRQLRERFNPSELPVLLLTAKSEPRDLAEGFEAGANDYLTKPIHRSELLARVRIQLQLSQLNLSLEELVAERTAALEKANRKLASSMRETIDAMTEISVLEERNRIAQEIHDIVGHTLTVINIQIEAAKRLLLQNRELGMEKLDLSQHLVRKSLGEVRQSVRMLRDQGTEGSLRDAMLQLLRDTRQAAGVEIDEEVDDLPELDAQQRRALYRALQEGLTNGIRHGGSTRFRFRLTFRERELRFELSNNGRRFDAEEMGFGLRSMTERVQHLGGTLQIAPDGDTGCRITLMLPVA
ncbi:ATP-binding protein [Paenibacillus caseinilyticus]|uniref:Oxygen sensor histidine kinase NreB n=1 Tax=Paenibacillus mucilaginosus K02 TaxID=997761 RepID=I0BHH9_9BACL|nr:ATP-binding protein [Paenibacillus mucilaginosus]AFH61826.2 histidine kinase [Paenibacillus mucilaginosus K02]